MPRFKRTRSKVDETDSESGGSPTIGKRSNKRNKLTENAPATDCPPRSLPQKLAVYIVAAKLESNRIKELSNLVEESTEYSLAKNAGEADVIVTGTGVRERLERSVPVAIIDQKPILKPEWLEKSIKEGKRQPYHQYQALYLSQDEAANGVELPDDHYDRTIVTSAQAALSPSAKYACQRQSPLVCPNQDLVEQLAVLKRARELDLNWESALSYARAIASIKAYPRKIQSAKEARKLAYVGDKTELKVIREYLKSGQISETKSILEGEKYRVLMEFSSIYGIGPMTAQVLYARRCRTLEDVKRFYKDPDNAALEIEEDDDDEDEEKNVRVPERWIEVSLALKDDLSIKIPRREVEQVARMVMHELEEIQPGCLHTIAGGYRRGKRESNDIDIVITHPAADANRVRELCQEFTDVLSKKGLVTHLMTLTGQHSPSSSPAGVIAKAFTIFSLPGSGRSRRLDLIFAVPDVYWTAVVGWTGSTMFQRDLRLHAKSKDLKFDSSGITRRTDESVIIAHSEKDVFEILGLPYIHPTMRNADP
ncbi:hypothetical protein BJ322DRAFT_514143 [Thelephora terrestris]|uniref:DNA polymerase n=1 Tax=Thelephora terrestris TaxID=56493 RepID=A0A9P6H2L2_9AGAM|nr:hypothetical protein BJ322DRAFT_514143 [Thelephora terrestris]